MTEPSKLNNLAARFVREFRASPELQARHDILCVRSRRAQQLLVRERILELTEDEVRELFFDSDAFTLWKNKEANFRDRLQKRGLDGLRRALRELVTRGEAGLTPEDLEHILSLRGLGPALATELLSYRFPHRYAAQTKETWPALQFVGLDVEAPRGRGSKAREYFALEQPLQRVLDALYEAGAADADYLLVQVFLAWLTHAQHETDATLTTWQGALVAALAAKGLHFPGDTVADFISALQAKGFVILSGISGTGKTRLVQEIAALLPQPSSSSSPVDGAMLVTVQPYMLKHGRIAIPKPAMRWFDPPQPGQTREVIATVDGRSHNAKLACNDASHVQLCLRGAARTWFTKHLSVGDTLLIEPEIDDDADRINFRLFRHELAPKAVSNRASSGSAGGERNLLFLSVRPDWRDSKPLLGYFNPLTGCYEWTPFLRFLVAAQAGYRAGDNIARFVLLDEMNLARVEYYLADLLSVLESGRDENGWTREALRLQFPADADGDLPPAELYLPPNLYLLGTVNEDETTHAFSPKVLDRAWTLELGEVDFTNYNPTVGDTSGWTEPLRAAFGRDFVRNGRFTHWTKADVARVLAKQPFLREHLQTLNERLREFGLHFGYRVFDEIALFLAAAGTNGLAAGEEPAVRAFDAAVSHKILPRIVNAPTSQNAVGIAVLAWCLAPSSPNEDEVRALVEKQDCAALQRLLFIYNRTARGAIAMLRARMRNAFSL